MMVIAIAEYRQVSHCLHLLDLAFEKKEMHTDKDQAIYEAFLVANEGY